MIGKHPLSDTGRQRRDHILKLAIEKGDRLRKRRRLVRGSSIVAAIAALVAVVVSYNVTREAAERRLIARNQPLPAADDASIQDEANSTLKIHIISSDSLSIQDYIVRTTQQSTSVIILDDDAVIDAMKDIDPSVGIVRAGGRVWLTRGDVPLSEIH